MFVAGGYAVQLDRRGGNPYNVTLVSRHWRDVAYSTPQLWVILPGHYPQLWERILKRSGVLPLRIESYKKAPIERQPWPLVILGDPACYDRLQGLRFEWCGSELKGRIRAITPSNSILHVHLDGGNEYDVWGDPANFLTFIQGLPHMSYLGLEGGCIPKMTWGSTVPIPHTRFSHPNLRCLYLKGWACQRVSQFLDSIPLQTLERLELHVKCLQDVVEIRCLGLQRVFRDFWEGRRDTPRSPVVVQSEGILEITLRQCQTSGHEPGCNPKGPLLKLTAAGFEGTAQMAWATLAKVMPMDVEEVVLHSVPV